MKSEKNKVNDYTTEAKGVRILSANMLKVIACLSMLTDHIGRVLMADNSYMNAVGRLAFPIFAFLLVQGMFRTSNIRNYIIRLMGFAVVSEIPFDLALHGRLCYMESQNVFFTLATGLLAIYAMEDNGFLGRFKVEIAVAAALGAEFLRLDYGMAGIGLILLFYWGEKLAGRYGDHTDSMMDAGGKSHYGMGQNILITGISTVIYAAYFGMGQLYAVFAMLPLNMYSGKKGVLNLKYAFYMFYPLHLLVLWGFTQINS